MFKNCAILSILAIQCLTAYAIQDAESTSTTAVPIIKSEVNKHEDGSYDVIYEGGDGTSRQEQGSFIDAGTENEVLEVKGSYKYINDDGEEIEVFYTAGKNGFVPYGSIINPEITATAEKAKDLPVEYTKKTEKPNNF